MPTAGELSYVLKGLGFQDNQVAHIMNSYNDIERIKDLFLKFNDDKLGHKDELKKLVDNKNFSDPDIRHLVLLIDWYDQQVRKPDFDWKQFNHSDFIGFKRQTKVDKQNSKASSTDTTNISTAGTDTSTDSALDFSADVFRKDVTGVTNRANAGPTQTRSSPILTGNLPSPLYFLAQTSFSCDGTTLRNNAGPSHS
jgi:hypothetical protein